MEYLAARPGWGEGNGIEIDGEKAEDGQQMPVAFQQVEVINVQQIPGVQRLGDLGDLPSFLKDAHHIDLSQRPVIAVVLFFPIANGQLGGEQAVDLGIERTLLFTGLVQDLVFLHFGRGAQKEFVFGKAAKGVVQQLVGSVVKGLVLGVGKGEPAHFFCLQGQAQVGPRGLGLKEELPLFLHLEEILAP